MSDEITFKLFKPITAHGDKLEALILRRPTVKELRTHGSPYTVVAAGGGGAKADYVACAALIAEICGIPPSSVDQLDAADFDDMAMTLVGFTKRATVAGTAPQSPSAN